MSYNLVPVGLPSFLDDPSKWHDLMCNESQWSRVTSQLHFYESACDKQHGPHDDARFLAYACPQCDKAFSSQKTLQSHARSKHGARVQIRAYIRDAVCPCCGVDFVDRVRCLAHLSDSRRTKCKDWILQHVLPISDCKQLQALDEKDTQLRRDARRAGRSHHIAALPATRPDGRVIGRIS